MGRKNAFYVFALWIYVLLSVEFLFLFCYAGILGVLYVFPDRKEECLRIVVIAAVISVLAAIKTLIIAGKNRSNNH